jgi:hypothetical protein
MATSAVTATLSRRATHSSPPRPPFDGATGPGTTGASRDNSYPQQWYEDAIGRLLDQVGSLSDYAIREIVGRYQDRPAEIDRASLVRVSRDREEAGRRLAKTRDVLAWQREMAQLDADEQMARGAVEPERLSPTEVVAYLRSLLTLWTDAGPEGRQVLATALFARSEVLGFEQMEYELTPDAVELGLGEALPAVFEMRPRKIGEFGRGERSKDIDFVLIG